MSAIRRVASTLVPRITWPEVSSVLPVLLPAGVLVALFKLAISDGGRHTSTLALVQTVVLATTAALAATGRIKHSSINWPLAAIIAASVITSMWSVRPEASLHEILLWMTYGSIAILVRSAIPHHHAMRWFIDGAVVIGGWLALIAFFTFWGANNPGMRWYSTFYWPNPFAAFLLLLLPIQLMRMVMATTSKDALAHGALAWLLAVPFVLTYSRGAWLSLVAGAVLTIPLMKLPLKGLHFRRLAVLVFAVGAIAAALTMNSGTAGSPVVARARSTANVDDYSLQGRLNFWRAAVAVFADYPLTGTGPGTFGAVHTRYQRDVRYYARDPHSLYLQVGAEMGIAGILTLAVLLWRAGRLWLGAISSAAGRPEHATMAGLGFGLTAFFLHSGLDMNWMFPANPAMACALLGVIAWYAMPPARLRNEMVRLSRFGRIGVCATLAAAVLAVNILYAAETHFSAGQSLARSGAWSEAAVRYDQATRLNPLNAKYRGASAAEAVRRKPPAVDLAASQLRKAMALDRMNATYSIQLARMFMDHPTPQRLNEAEHLLKKALELDRWNRPEAYRLLARLLRQQDRTAEAAAVYRTSVALYLSKGLGRPAIIYILLWPEVTALGIDAAEFLGSRGEQEEARAILTNMLAEDPENQNIRKALATLDGRP